MTSVIFLLSENRIRQSRAESDGVESDLSSMFPKVGCSSHLSLMIRLLAGTGPVRAN